MNACETTITENESMTPPMDSVPEGGQVTAQGSYGQILKSSALIGGSQVLNIAIGVVRNKVMAVLLGPSGFGLAGLYTSIVDLGQNIAGLGINSSGVRQIAEAVGSNDVDRIGLTIAVLRKTAVVLGVFGAALLALSSRRVSILTFGTPAYSFDVAVVAFALFCKLVSGGQTALIQGLRRIGDLAKINVVGALLGTAIGLALVWALRDKGIVAFVIAVAASGLFVSWFYSRKVKIEAPTLSVLQIRNETSALLKLGVAFMISSLMTLGVAYVTRVTVMHKVGLQGTGLYQCAWALGGMYVGFVLQAMAADFYPRLTASIHDHPTCNRLVNEQARVGLLLAGPGVILTLTFAPAVIALLYSANFDAAVPVLRWICLGATLQVITWPMGFIIVAKGRQNLFIFAEVAWAVVSVGLVWVGVLRYGVIGAGMAFFGSYVFHAFLIYPVARHLSGFRWSGDNVRTVFLFLSLIGLVFVAPQMLPPTLAQVFGVLVAGFAGAYSIRVLNKLVASEDLPRPLRRLLASISTRNIPAKVRR